MHWNELARNLPALFGALFLAILFIQSGLDKVYDWKGNLGWLNEHFSKTFLAGLVPVLLGTITATELATGFLGAAGIVYFLATGSTAAIFFASVIGAGSISALFFGQRVAKDYPGAAVLVPYFLLMLTLMYLTNPYSKM
jgi:hypothetical protein